jgi:hypothetical protein
MRVMLSNGEWQAIFVMHHMVLWAASLRTRYDRR